MNPDLPPSVTPAPPARRGVGQLALFAAVAFGPVTIAYALGVWGDMASFPRPPTKVLLGWGGLFVLLILVLLWTYALWKRTGERLVRGVVLLLTQEFLFFCLGLFLAEFWFQPNERPDWPGNPLVPTLGYAALSLFYAQALIFPSVVVATLTAGGCIPAAERLGQRRTSFRAVLFAVLAAVLPPAAVVATHVRFVRPLMSGYKPLAALSDAVEDVGRAMERYAAAHAGQYPPGGISWEPGDSTSMAYWFQPYDDGWHRDSSNTPVGHLPDNPFTGRRYQVGVDFFYLPDKLEHSGDNRRVSTEKDRVAFAGMKAPKGKPGTIAILGYTPHTTAPRPTEYALVVYLRDVSEPWHNSRRYHYKDYIVRYGPKTDSLTGGK